MRRALQKEASDAWHELLARKVNPTINPDLPVLSAWQLATNPEEQVQIARRNPYYWKVDPEGKQLPYIDELK